MKKLLCGCVAAALVTAAASVAAMDNFVAAKKELPKITRALDNPATVYCAVPITFNERGRWQVDPLAAGYKVRKNAKRAVRIEAEHVMPAWDFVAVLGRQKRPQELREDEPRIQPHGRRSA